MSLIRFYGGINGKYISCSKYMRFLKPFTKIYKKKLRKLYAGKSKEINQIAAEIKNKGSKKVVAVFLQYQPEASTMPKGGVFYNQEKLIDFLQDLDGISLVVREHPNQFSTMYARQPETFRNKAFYRNDVHWHTHDETPYDLFSMADIVISVGGTVLIESMLRGLPSIALGKSFFSDLDQIHNVKSYEELRHLLGKEISEIKPDSDKFTSEMLSLQEYVIPAVIGGNVNLKQIGLTEEENATNLRLSFEKFFNNHER